MRRGRRGKENHDEIQLESDDVCQSGGNLVVIANERTDPLLEIVIKRWAMIPMEVKVAIATICGAVTSQTSGNCRH